ncbi:unnamed protein product [Polarella glacialis]|uniref:PDZ domain-containing protein n=1 Tax=Polarella glacialis TaxID=89957 RepID=A0A813D8N7_POLGL|nr:unnamed protein product [Polarella glacialis]
MWGYCCADDKHHCCADDKHPRLDRKLLEDSELVEQFPSNDRSLLKLRPWRTESSPTFDVTLDCSKGKHGLGLQLDLSDSNVCVVVSVLPEGHVDIWNRGHPTNCRVKAMDRLVAVNGQTGNTHMLIQRLKGTLKPILVELTFEHPRLIQIEIPCRSPGQILGLALKGKGDSQSLIISNVLGGVVHQYNETVDPESRVKRSDRVVAVNGQEASPSELIKLLRGSEEKDIAVTLMTWRG